MIKKIILWKRESGFTLSETVVYIAVLGIVMSGIVMIVVQMIKMKTTSDTMRIMNNEITNLYEKIGYDIKNAESFEVTESTSLSITKDGSEYRYYLDGTKVLLDDGDDIHTITSNMVVVAGLEIADWTTVNSDSLIHIRIQLSRGNFSEIYETNFHKR
ncbi:MAG: prepilin-type N-terminal cleavage/methylation domain-containing protein [Candidatus Dojkabacteria bacterium]|jgi:hypothetical protein|nr:prepilin-type N-terminal cleavage/methylation domain-containing protein [Candidatus Dojkabacteria bacterium]